MRNIEISLIIPIYNVAKYLKDCLESVITQENVEYEAILVNDGSTDNSEQIAEEYVCRSRKFSMISQRNQGLSAARNAGIELAKGKYIQFLDADDKLAYSNSLHDAVFYMEDNQLDMLEFDAQSVYESYELEKNAPQYAMMYRRKQAYGIYNFGKELFLELYKKGEYYPSACIRTLRKGFIDDKSIRFINGLIYEDNIFTLQCYMESRTVMHINKVMMLRLVRNNSIIQSVPKINNLESIIRVYFEIENIWNIYGTAELDDAFAKLCEETKEIIIYLHNRISDNGKNNIVGLRAISQHILNDVLYKKKHFCVQDYAFPYHLFNNNDNIMIYGAGNVGKIFWQLANDDRIVRIDGIMDRRGNVASEKDMKVEGLDNILLHRDSKWLIAIENDTIAKQAKKGLVEKGICEKNIFWDGSAYRRSHASRKYIELRKMTRRFLSQKQKERIFVFMQPEHGNIGDYAISLGEHFFLKDYFSEYEILWVTTDEWKYSSDVLVDAIDVKDIIMINGGGYVGNIWSSWQTCKEIIGSFPDNIKILFPNTLSYIDEIDNNNIALLDDIEWMKRQTKLYAFWRDIHSFRFLEKYAPSRNAFFPDMALYIKKRKNTSPFNGCLLLCLRNDVEKKNDEIEIRERIEKLGYEITERDINLARYLSLEEGYELVYSYLGDIKNYDLVITDRLHAMILAVLADVPCVAMDNLTRKISGVYPWVRDGRISVVENIEEINSSTVHDTINKQNGYMRPEKEFVKMKTLIQSLIAGKEEI